MNDRLHKTLLIGLFLLALSLRTAGMTVTLPHSESEKEQRNVNTALMMGATKSLNPQQVGKGMIWYLLLAEYGAYYAFGKMFGTFDSTFDFAKSIFVDRTVIYLMSRVTQVVLALWTLWLLYRICRKILGGTAGLWGLLFGTVSAGHVTSSFHASEDMLVVLFSLLALKRLIDYSESRSLKPLILSTVFAAACASSKIPGGIVLLSILMVLAAGREWKRMILAVLVFSAGYLILNPFILAAPLYSLSSLLHDLQIRRMTTDQSIWDSLYVLCAMALGWPLALIAAAGFFAPGTNRRLLLLIAGLPPVAFMAVLGQGSGIGSETYLFAIWPMLMLMGVSGMVWLSRAWPGWAAGAAATAAVLTPLFFLPEGQNNVFNRLRQRLEPVPTQLMLKWVKNNIQARESIAMMSADVWKGRLFLTPERIRERIERFRQPPPYMDINYNVGNVRMYEFMLKVMESDSSIPCYNIRYLDFRPKAELEDVKVRATVNRIEGIVPYDEWRDLENLPERYFMFVQRTGDLTEEEKILLERLRRVGELQAAYPPYFLFLMKPRR